MRDASAVESNFPFLLHVWTIITVNNERIVRRISRDFITFASKWNCFRHFLKCLLQFLKDFLLYAATKRKMLPSLALEERKSWNCASFCVEESNLFAVHFPTWQWNLFLVCCYEQKKHNNIEAFVTTEIVFMVIVKRLS